MKTAVCILAVLAASLTLAQTEPPMKSIHDFTMLDIEEKPVALSSFKGQVLLVVNTASKCGFTGQYKGLEALYQKYKDRGFAVLAFPANNFMRQEPGSNAEIQTFCTTRFQVTFPLFAKISVKGADIHPLYKFLTEKATNPDHAGDIAWNFNKFLIGRDGAILNRFGSRATPDHPALIQALETALGPETTTPQPQVTP